MPLTASGVRMPFHTASGVPLSSCSFLAMARTWRVVVVVAGRRVKAVVDCWARESVRRRACMVFRPRTNLAWLLVSACV